MSFTRKSLSDFLSQVFVIALGVAPQESPDAYKMRSNVLKWIEENKENLQKKRRSIARLLVELRQLLFPYLLDPEEDRIGLQDFIAAKIRENYKKPVDELNLSERVQEASVSAARKLYDFFEMLEEKLVIDLERDAVESESEEWGGNLLNEIFEPRKKEIAPVIDLASVLKEVFYKETAHYILEHLDRKKMSLSVPPARAPSFRIPQKRPQLEDIVLKNPFQKEGDSAWAIQPEKSAENADLNEAHSFSQKKEGALIQKSPLLFLLALLGMTLISPLSIVVGFIYWDLWKKRKAPKKSASVPILPSEIFAKTEEKPKRHALSQPCELLSDSDSSDHPYN